MKNLKYLLLIVICLFSFNVYALRTSRYEATFETDEVFQGNQIVTYFGFKGEETKKTELTIEVDNSMLNLEQVVAGDNYKVEYKEEKISNNKKKYKITYETDTLSDEYMYGAIVFTLTDNFKVNKSTELKVYDVISYGEDSKYRSLGYYINLKRTGKNNMLAIRTDINDETNRQRTIDFFLPFVVIGIILIIIIIAVILMLPSRKIENRRDKINYQLDKKNYPIPGVGPLPKMKKKTKSDVIEPEEKVIQPLSEFLSKSDDVNEELMNKDLEVDKTMFKDNPKKEGEDGLININPLAFDDGEDEILDDGHNK